MPPLYTSEDSQLIADLHKLSKKAPKLVRSTLYAAPSDPDVKVRSWKMNEFKYYDIPSPFPTLARGLFSMNISPGEDGQENTDGGKYRIVARGYDKFFNIGEVPWTNWESIQSHTSAPYTLTLKSNGCIIFIAALTSSKLLVTSKHAIGPMEGVSETHSEAGHRWLRQHLTQAGKTEAQLAAALWEKNWTAIAELCDDSFEEHVLPYSAEKSGLHLHGINESTKVFRTLPTTMVDAFADEWGFIKTASITFQTVAEVKEFSGEIGKTGKWNGEALEGFVVRTHVRESEDIDGNTPSAPPYPPGSSFFFKVKFNEPYMMYRDWREVTKTLLSTKGSLDDAKFPRSKLKRPETQVYLKWVKGELTRDRSAFSEYSKGKGIIRTRERFLEWMEGDGKKDLKDTETSELPGGHKEFGKTVIVPIAIPGCGKTTVSVALAHLFKFGHTQSDDVQAKKSAPAFIKNVVELLKTHDVVIADKNNHLIQHREQLREAVLRMHPPVRLLALNWELDAAPPATIHRICGDRVLTRGDNHQSLRADKQTKSHEHTIWQFIQNHEELVDNEVDVTIGMDVEDTLEQSINRAIDGCVNVLGIEPPDEDRIKEAMHVALEYAPTLKKSEDRRKKKEDLTPRYYGFLPEVDLNQIIGEKFNAVGDIPESGKAFWEELISQKQVAERPHVTIVHRNSLPAETGIWEQCSALHRMAVPPSFKFNLGHLVWNNRVMAITVDDVELDIDARGHADHGQEGYEFISKLPEEVRRRLHITVGTRDADPFEGKSIVEAWRKGDGDGVGFMELEGVVARGRIKGLTY